MLLKPAGCSGCVLEKLGHGFMQPSGTGKNGVLLVGEALGAQEAEVGSPFVGKAGFTLERILSRGGMEKNDFKIANAVWCQPPYNKLAGEWYGQAAVDHCSPYLDSVIADMAPRCIVALGATAFHRLVPDIHSGVLDARGYVFWSERYKTWVVPTAHPSFVMRGKTAWAQVLLFDIQKAVDIAREGYEYVKPDYKLDCTPAEAMEWVLEFEAYAKDHPDLYLSTDIETPDKDADEEGLELEDGQDYIILRCGYSYRDRHGLSIPWDGPYAAIHQRLLSHPCQKVFWNGSFDVPRILACRFIINGAIHDAMDAWHVLNSDLKKSLGFVTPFFCMDQPMWKHLSKERPAYYNCVDADVAGRNMRGTVEQLKKHGLWKVYNDFICELDPVFSAMTRAGMPVDQSRRIESAQKLQTMKENVRRNIQAIIPEELRPVSPKKGYIKEPDDKTGLTEIVVDGVEVKYCPNCGEQNPKKSHFKVSQGKFCSECGEHWVKKHSAHGTMVVRTTNLCGGLEPVVKVEGIRRWAKVEDFVPSQKGILNYQDLMKHQHIYQGKGTDKRPTTNEKAIRKLMQKYPKDKFYPLVLEDRELTKLLGTYIGYAVED